MKHFRFYLLFILILLPGFLISQENITDTIYADKLLKDAHSGLKNRQFQYLDSFLVSFEKAADIQAEIDCLKSQAK